MSVIPAPGGMGVRLPLLAAVMLLLPGCGGGLQVSRVEDVAKLEGIPFYRKVGVCRTETVYALSAVQIRAEVRAGGAKGPVVLSAVRRTPEIDEAWALMTSYAGKQNTASVEALRKGLQELDDLHSREGVPTKSELESMRVARHTTIPVAVPDYTAVYSVKTEVPFQGSADLSVELAEDGTLTEVTSKVEDETLSTVLSPVTEVISSTSLVETEDGEDYSVTIRIQPLEVRHSFARLAPVRTKAPVRTQEPVPDGSDTTVTASAQCSEVKLVDIVDDHSEYSLSYVLMGSDPP